MPTNTSPEGSGKSSEESEKMEDSNKTGHSKLTKLMNKQTHRD